MIVPGSIFGINHPFSWYANVKDRKTGKEWTYWMNGSQLTRGAVALHIATHYPGVEMISCDQCTGPPTRAIQPVPPTHFQHGVLQAVEDEIAGPRESAIRLIPRKTIERKPLWRSPS